ncbi:hypothetical protein PIB30_018500 [Stylosanthes scabra]|uniref:glucose-6-phosphate 1-epimerase n=1 Tax=Stylosanthes scabra TaxID=79078 RepID=A0ABU6X8R5_9FABA|nr:hypothetical protein [Stylosanthes scabra]
MRKKRGFAPLFHWMWCESLNPIDRGHALLWFLLLLLHLGNGVTLRDQSFLDLKHTIEELRCGLNSPPINPFASGYTEFGKLIRVYAIVLRNSRGALARVSLHGAQVTSWKNEHGEELLFTSSKAIFKSPKAMRGGIPICFPQFGTCGSLELHGFARNRMWFIDDNPPPLPANDSIGKSFVDLLLKSSEEDMKCWPHSFEFRLRVSLTSDGDLNLISRVRNINGKPFSFSFAYHTYLLVSDISEIRIEGLETLDYLDYLLQKERFTEQGDAITFESEVDRVYLSSPNAIAVLDHERKRTFVIRKEGLPDVGVWNPWDKKAKSMVDMGDEEYKHMLCVDGAVIEKPVILKPGEEWTGRLQLSVVASSFCSERLGLDRDGL